MRLLDLHEMKRLAMGSVMFLLCCCLQDGEVVLGVLGCPNLPQGTVADDDGGAGALCDKGYNCYM
jgi:3'(2'), 5'-bisphosphate nucleotidase/inositol polyphosphate 1-phosphatase